VSQGVYAPRWPTFLVIGAARSGTSSMYFMFREHPLVHVPAVKEVNHFSLRALGIELSAMPEHVRRVWGPSVSDIEAYRELFAVGVSEEGGSIGAEPVAFGECSPSYLPVPGAAALIHADVPECRLVVMLRDPVERAVSHHAHNLKFGIESDANFASALEADFPKNEHGDYYYLGLYARQLAPYFELFGREQVLLVDYHELARDFSSVARRVFAHVGADPDVAEIPLQHRLSTEPAPVPRSTLDALALRYREDTSRLVDEFGFGPARNWSSFYG
jgi:hypothetical protein